ncbi:hypothetical protein PR048_003576 [Dryococelus australis]|uniref:Uncharacterized protein n=1 Tax=Dryococelus australis TaxID=614101 RepID=A0ABQ9ING6_9NEOP|nr:hypothetical protein PR048_003576 [Dryococelus australis]
MSLERRAGLPCSRDRHRLPGMRDDACRLTSFSCWLAEGPRPQVTYPTPCVHPSFRRPLQLLSWSLRWERADEVAGDDDISEDSDDIHEGADDDDIDEGAGDDIEEDADDDVIHEDDDDTDDYADYDDIDEYAGDDNIDEDTDYDDIDEYADDDDIGKDADDDDTDYDDIDEYADHDTDKDTDDDDIYKDTDDDGIDEYANDDDTDKDTDDDDIYKDTDGDADGDNDIRMAFFQKWLHDLDGLYQKTRRDRDSGGVVVRLLASHLGEPGSILCGIPPPPDSHLWESCRTMLLVVRFSRDLPLPRRCISTPLHTNLVSLLAALNTSFHIRPTLLHPRGGRVAGRRCRTRSATAERGMLWNGASILDRPARVWRTGLLPRRWPGDVRSGMWGMLHEASLSARVTAVTLADLPLRSCTGIPSRERRGEGGKGCNAQEPERGLGGNERSLRKPADQQHRPARFPHAKIREWPGSGIEPGSSWWQASRLTAQPPRAQHYWNFGRYHYWRRPPVRRWSEVREVMCSNPKQGMGAAVAERLACSPPTKANRAQSPAGATLGFSDVGIVLNDAATRWVFWRISRPPLFFSFRRCSVLTSVTLIGSQDLALRAWLAPATGSSAYISPASARARALCVRRGTQFVDLLSASALTTPKRHTTSPPPPLMIIARAVIGAPAARTTHLAHHRSADAAFTASPGLRTRNNVATPLIFGGAVVSERLDCSPLTKVNRVQFPAVHYRIYLSPYGDRPGGDKTAATLPPAGLTDSHPRWSACKMGIATTTYPTSSGEKIAETNLLTNSLCGKRNENLPPRRCRGASPWPSDYRSATLPLSYGATHVIAATNKKFLMAESPLELRGSSGREAKINEQPINTKLRRKDSKNALPFSPYFLLRESLRGTTSPEKFHFSPSCPRRIPLSPARGVSMEQRWNERAGKREIPEETRQPSAGMKGRGKREIPEKIRLPKASSGTTPTCENPE